MLQGKCCICGTVRNCALFLDKVLENCKTIGSLFEDYKIVISYDISTDNSKEILENFCNTLGSNKMTILCGPELYDLSPFRVYNIARARNQCLDYIRQNCSDYEYFIMIDCDDVCSAYPAIEHLEYYLTNNTEWDALSFNKKPYYDLWALSKYPYSFSCMHYSNWKQWGEYIEKILASVPEKTLIPCLSAFNGFSIYRTNKFLNCYYDPKPRPDLIPPHMIEATEKVTRCKTWLKGKAGLIDCEHRSFHFMAIRNNGARIRIAPEVLFD